MKLRTHSVVLYKGQPAIITGEDSGKLTIKLESDEKKVRDKDIIPLHEGPVTSIDALLSAPLPSGTMEDALDFFTAERPSYRELTELIWGAYPAEASWVIWKAVSSSPLFSCQSPAEPIGIRTPEEIALIRFKEDEKMRASEVRSLAIARLKAVAAGKGALTLPEDGQTLQDIEALSLGLSDKSRSLKEAGLSETREEAHRILIASGLWPLERNPWPNRHGLSLNSSTAVIPPPPGTEGRLDLSHLDAWAIDNEWSADPDDAVSIDGEAVWIHVADPAETVLPDSDADRDARSRGSTLYVPEGASRMLADEALPYFALGLQDRSCALSFRVTFNESGSIDEVSIHRTVVRVSRLTYAEASARSEEAPLKGLFAIAKRNVERRRKAGAVFIDLPEVHISVSRDGDGTPLVRFERVKDEKAAVMVREMMLIAGEAAARFAFKNSIPFQYVSQETPDIPKDLPPGLAGEYRKRRSMRSRKVGTIPQDHAGLGLGMYSQVTSPLRRYGDLVSHQQLHRFLSGEPLLDTDDMLTRIAQGDSAARECTLAERESNAHWILYHLASNPDWEGEAAIVEVAGNAAVIIVLEFAYESRIPLPPNAGLNDVIRVKAARVNIPEQSVTFLQAEG